MLTTYFLGGILKWKNCKTRIEAVKTSSDQIPKDIEYIISLDTVLKSNADDVKKKLSEKGCPKCKVNSSGKITWYSKKSKPCANFKCPDLDKVTTDSTVIVGFEKSLDKLLNQSLNKSPGKVRIESTESIEFGDEHKMDGKNRIYPSIALLKMLRRKKKGEVKFRGNLVLDTRKPCEKSFMDLLGKIKEFRQVIVNIYPLIKTINSFTICTPNATITCKLSPGFSLDWFPTFTEKISEKTVSLVLECITDLMTLV